DLEHFKSCIRSMRTVHDKKFNKDDGKTTGVLPIKKSKTGNQEPQSKTDLEKSITKFLDGQRVANMFVKNNVNDMILKMKRNEKNFQTIYKNIERKIDEWSKSQNHISSELTDRTEPPPPAPARTEHVNVVEWSPDGVFDVCVDLIWSSPLTQTEMIDFVPGRAVIDATHCKRDKYEARCENTGYGFLPFSFSSYEELEKDAVALLKRI
ncbi:hypothetical protein Tco_1325528, partial [Tanacetum coccineum]